MNTFMKTFLFIILLTTYSHNVYSADAKEIIQLRAAENIEIVSQRIAKFYFYLHQNIASVQSRIELIEQMDQLQKDIKILASNSSDDEQKYLVDFLTFTYDELKITVADKYSMANGSLVLDYTEALLEGAESITQKHINQKDKEEGMLVHTQKMEFFVERSNKYYIAFKAGISDDNLITQILTTVKAFEEKLQYVNSYKYPLNKQKSVDSLNRYWPYCKKFYLNAKTSDQPRIVLASTRFLDEAIEKLIDYHYKNLMKK